MRYTASVTAILASLALGSTMAVGQQSRQDGGTQGRGAPSEQQVRNFFDQTEQTLRQAVRNQSYRQAAQYIRRHLAEDATFVAANSLSIDGRQVATSVVTVDDDTFSDILGFAASAMQGGGRKNVQGYRLEIDVRDMQPVRGENALRVSTVIRESGQLQAGQDGAGGQGRQQQSQLEQMGQQSQRDQQAQFGQRGQGQGGMGQGGMGQSGMGQSAGMGQGMRQGRGQGMERDQQTADIEALDQQGYGEQRGALSRGIGGQQAQFQTNSQCEHLIRLGPDGNIRIGSTVCRGNTLVRSQS